MKQSIFSLLMGLLFAIGLGISGMTNPKKVIDFIDILGKWDPSLAFVMGGAMGVFLLGYRLVKIPKPFMDSHFSYPHKTKLDSSLIIGSAIFGIGWALAGFCPGPGIVAVVTFSNASIAFVLSMALGISVYHMANKIKDYEDG